MLPIDASAPNEQYGSEKCVCGERGRRVAHKLGCGLVWASNRGETCGNERHQRAKHTHTSNSKVPLLGRLCIIIILMQQQLNNDLYTSAGKQI